MNIWLTSNEISICAGLSLGLQSFLNCLDLLWDGGQHPFFQPVELVETTPRAHLAQTDEDPTHGLEIEGLVAVEDQHETTQLVAESFHGLGFTRTSGT